MFLSVADPDPQHFYQFGLCVSLIVSVVAPIITILLTRGKQKREVSFEAEPATRKDFEAHLHAEAMIHARLDSELHDLRIERKSDVAGLYDKVNKVAEDVAAIRGAMHSFTENTKSQITRLDELVQEKADKRK